MAKKLRSTAARFGARYGRTVRKRLADIEVLQRAVYKCPYCSYKKVKRLAAGIWHCRKCDVKFTSKAYTVTKVPEIKLAEEE